MQSAQIFNPHDTDPLFRSSDFQGFLNEVGIKSKSTSFKSPWQNGICERGVGILRRELLDHIIPLNERHLQQLLWKFQHQYYNSKRTHQAINCETPIKTVERDKISVEDVVLKGTPILGGLYHSYEVAA